MHEIIYSAEYQQAANLQVACHTTQNGQNKWTKILAIEITISGLKMMVKSGLEKINQKFHEPLQRYRLT